MSGAGRDRPEFKRMLDQLREGDVLIVCRLDRLARSTKILLETIEQLRELGATFRSLNESWADTTSATGKLVMTFFAGMAEFERDLIRERTKRWSSRGPGAWRKIWSTTKTQHRATKTCSKTFETGKVDILCRRSFWGTQNDPVPIDRLSQQEMTQVLKVTIITSKSGTFIS
ncbi:MAG: recombinase family protein [Nitrososphaera sp.]|nr:recombinase family protein [Nitrososphaera sp.]